MNIIAGIDEAGRGPLIGDMFMVIVVMEKDRLPMLRELGVKDSKKLSKNQRERIFPHILSNSLIVSAARATPQQIDNENLNVIELRMICKLIKTVSRLYTINTIYIDAFSNPSELKIVISRTCNISEHSLVIKYNADNEFPIVGAASIVAKILRDNYIAILKRIYGEFGSGYPSDYRTIQWIEHYLRKYSEIPPIVRKSWRTVRRILAQL